MMMMMMMMLKITHQQPVVGRTVSMPLVSLSLRFQKHMGCPLNHTGSSWACHGPLRFVYVSAPTPLPSYSKKKTEKGRGKGKKVEARTSNTHRLSSLQGG